MAPDQILFITETDKHGEIKNSIVTSEIDYLFEIWELLKAELDYQDSYYSPDLADDYSDELIKLQEKIRDTKDPSSLSGLIRMEDILIKRIARCEEKHRSIICMEINRVEQRIHVLSNSLL